MSLQGELGKAQEDIKALHSEQDRINKTITKTNEDMKELQKKFSDGPSSSQPSPGSEINPVQEVMRLSSKITEAQKERDSAKGELASLRSEKDHLDTKVAELTNQISHLTTTNTKLNTTSKDLREEVDGLKAEIQQQNDKVAELEATITQMTSDATKTNQDFDSYRDSSTSELQTHQNKVRALEAEVSECKVTKSENEKSIRDLELEISKYHNRVSTLPGSNLEARQALESGDSQWCSLISVIVQMTSAEEADVDISTDTFDPLFRVGLFDTMTGKISLKEETLPSQLMADRFIGLDLGQVHEQVSSEAATSESSASEPAVSESANSPSAMPEAMDVEQPLPPEGSAMDVDERERRQARQVGPSDVLADSDPPMGILSLLSLHFRENETARDEAFALAVLCMWFTPNKDTADKWSDDAHAIPKFQLAYMSILKYRSSHNPLTFWICTNCLLVLHSLAKFNDESVWIKYLTFFRGSRRIHDMGLFSKACWTRLITLTCSRDLSRDLLPHDDYDRFSMAIDSPLDIYKAIRPQSPSIDVVAKQPRLLNTSELLFEHTEREGKHYTVICSKGSKIVFVMKPGEGYTALLGDPRVDYIDTVSKFIWTKNFTMEFNKGLDFRAPAGLKEMKAIFREATITESRTPNVPKVLFFGKVED
ncbi:hypothetical protein C1H76_7164 [Elsinoe australis]|uniref:Uncharacterized protein n=1 Tax=Elsinoe australis TaxID=40998 RepID=A0A4U7AWA9_9PEZI|nr:hypothetical protein C1H76_7164 [Elsinoe australis]